MPPIPWPVVPLTGTESDGIRTVRSDQQEKFVVRSLSPATHMLFDRPVRGGATQPRPPSQASYLRQPMQMLSVPRQKPDDRDAHSAHRALSPPRQLPSAGPFGAVG